MTIALRRRRPSRSRWRDLAAVLLPVAVGAAGGAVTAPAIPTWYRSLRKPAWNPPDAVFGPVWTVLYLAMGVALALVRRRADPDRTGRLGRLFGVQLALNFAWSAAFFGLRRPAAGVAVIVPLWLSIAATVVEFWRVRRLAGLLLLPYLAWTTFATALNVAVWRLNRS